MCTSYPVFFFSSNEHRMVSFSVFINLLLWPYDIDALAITSSGMHRNSISKMKKVGLLNDFTLCFVTQKNRLARPIVHAWTYTILHAVEFCFDIQCLDLEGLTKTHKMITYWSKIAVIHLRSCLHMNVPLPTKVCAHKLRPLTQEKISTRVSDDVDNTKKHGGSGKWKTST